MTNRRLLFVCSLMLSALAWTPALYADEGTETEPKPAESEDAPKSEKLPGVIKPMLWRIEGKTPGFLFGTVHVTDERVTKMHPLSIEAFKLADVVGLEVDSIKDAAAQVKAMQLPEGKVFEELVPAELIARLDARLKKISPMASRPALAMSGIKNLYPSAWGILVSSFDEMIKNMGKLALDAKLQVDAMKSGKEVVGMEKPSEQAALFSALNDEEQVIFLEACLDGYDEAEAKSGSLSAEIVELYLAGDAEQILKHAKADLKPNGKVTQALVDKVWSEIGYKRNARIAKKLVAMRTAAPDKVYFIAVGTMHLVGDRSVQHYLKQAGVTTTRVDDVLLVRDSAKDAAKKSAKETEPEPAGVR